MLVLLDWIREILALVVQRGIQGAYGNRCPFDNRSPPPMVALAEARIIAENKASRPLVFPFRTRARHDCPYPTPVSRRSRRQFSAPAGIARGARALPDRRAHALAIARGRRHRDPQH